MQSIFLAIIVFKGYVDFLSEEYKNTVILENKEERLNNITAESMNRVTRSQTKTPKIQLSLKEFVNPGKSLSVGKCDRIENGFVAFKATTNQGSSGGPLFDDKGKLLGIIFGNLQDVEYPERIDNSKIDETFDIGYPDEVMVEGSRNYNLAIAMNHSGLQEYLGLLNQDMV